MTPHRDFFLAPPQPPLTVHQRGDIVGVAKVGEVHHGRVSWIPGAEGEGTAALGMQQHGPDGEAPRAVHFTQVILRFLQGKTEL